jgi:trk system potassium uptake protein TrkH
LGNFIDIQMIIRPSLKDIKVVGFYLGRVTLGIGLSMLVPLAAALFFKEINPALDFCIGMFVALLAGFLLEILCYNRQDPNWMQGMVVVSLSWLAAMFVGAIPLFLSGHFNSYLDACFDAMSGFATTGLTLIQNLDHLSWAHNLWRHFMMFIGGQGIIIVALSFLVRGFSGAFKMYVGEAREERVLPNVKSSARFIWLVSFVYLFLWTIVLGMAGLQEGMKPLSAFFHGACIFMAAFDTGGFSMKAQNILYYHSFLFEIITVVIMILGAINFRLHYSLWTGNRREIVRNIETVTFFITVTFTLAVVISGLVKIGVYPQGLSLFRKGFYQLISAHTGTGYMTIAAGQFIKEWPALALVGIIMAMGLGGAACSTTGGIKALRIAVSCKAFVQEIKRIISSESTVTVEKFHHIKEVVLQEPQIRFCLLILLAYLFIYGLGALIGMGLGYPFLESLFESTSAAANVGLSCGITGAGMPTVLKLTYICQMWLGRLEFMSIFTLIGFIVAMVKGK